MALDQLLSTFGVHSLALSQQTRHRVQGSAPLHLCVDEAHWIEASTWEQLYLPPEGGVVQPLRHWARPVINIPFWENLVSSCLGTPSVARRACWLENKGCAKCSAYTAPGCATVIAVEDCDDNVDMALVSIDTTTMGLRSTIVAPGDMIIVRCEHPVSMRLVAESAVNFTALSIDLQWNLDDPHLNEAYLQSSWTNTSGVEHLVEAGVSLVPGPTPSYSAFTDWLHSSFSIHELQLMSEIAGDLPGMMTDTDDDDDDDD